MSGRASPARTRGKGAQKRAHNTRGSRESPEPKRKPPSEQSIEEYDPLSDAISLEAEDDDGLLLPAQGPTQLLSERGKGPEEVSEAQKLAHMVMVLLKKREASQESFQTQMSKVIET